MAGSDIQARVKTGIARGRAATGNGNDSVTITKRTLVNRDPINGDTYTTQELALNAISINFEKTVVDGTNIMSGDVMLTADSSVPIELDEVVNINGENFVVKDPGKVAPAGVVLVYKAQLRRA